MGKFKDGISIDLDFGKHEKKSKLLLLLLFKKKVIVSSVASVAAIGGATQLVDDEELSTDTPISYVTPDTDENLIDDKEYNEYLDKEIEDVLIENENNENLEIMFNSIDDAYYFDVDVISDYGWGTFDATLDLDATNLGREDKFSNRGGTLSTNTASLLLSNIEHSGNISLTGTNKPVYGVEGFEFYDLGLSYSQNLNMCKITEDSYNSFKLKHKHCITPALMYNPVRNLNPTTLTFTSVEEGIATYTADEEALFDLTSIAYAATYDKDRGSVVSATYSVDTKGTLSTLDDIVIGASYEYTYSDYTDETINLDVYYSNWKFRETTK